MMKKISVRKLETLRTTAALYGAGGCGGGGFGGGFGGGLTHVP